MRLIKINPGEDVVMDYKETGIKIKEWFDKHVAEFKKYDTRRASS